MSSEIKIMRLATGEELICDASSQTTSSRGIVYTIKDEPISDLKKQYQNMFSKVMTPDQKIVT